MIDLFCAGTHIHPTFDLFRLGSFALLLFGILSGACVSLFKAASIWADYGFACLCCTTEAYGDIYWYALIDWKDSWFGEKKGVGRKVLLEKLANFIVWVDFSYLLTKQLVQALSEAYSERWLHKSSSRIVSYTKSFWVD